MMETVEAPRSSDSFASLLAGFAAPEREDSAEWNVEGLADDIATISYEHTLRSHARSRSAEIDGGLRCPDTRETESTAVPPEARKGRNSHGVRSNAGDVDSRKSASVTIRLSQAECDQLHERAAAAGMTVSAYLRSCTFEVEALRAQVKEALAQFSTAADRNVPAKPVAPAQSWRSRFFPRLSGPRLSGHGSAAQA